MTSIIIINLSCFNCEFVVHVSADKRIAPVVASRILFDCNDFGVELKNLSCMYFSQTYDGKVIMRTYTLAILYANKPAELSVCMELKFLSFYLLIILLKKFQNLFSFSKQKTDNN